MIRRYRADRTPPTVAVEAREREVGPESLRVPERDLGLRLDLGEESLTDAEEAGDASENEVPEDGEDARTVTVEVDARPR